MLTVQFYSILLLGCLLSRTIIAELDVQSRILHGEVTTNDGHPFIVSITRMDIFKCCGTIITENTVLTAAQCLCDDIDPEMYSVIAERSNLMELGEEHEVDEVIVHPYYRDTEYDVGLVRIIDTFRLEFVSPILINEEDEDDCEGGLCTVLGWGKDLSSEQDDISFDLMMGKVHIFPQYLCRSFFAVFNTSICDSNMCTTGMESGCNGDSGGPLICDSTGKQIGVVNFGSFYCSGPSAYARISAAPIRAFITEYAGI